MTTNQFRRRLRLRMKDTELQRDMTSFLKGHTTLYWNERTGELRFVPRK